MSLLVISEDAEFPFLPEDVGPVTVLDTSLLASLHDVAEAVIATDCLIVCLHAQLPFGGRSPTCYDGLGLASVLAHDTRLHAGLLLLSFDEPTALAACHPDAEILLSGDAPLVHLTLPVDAETVASACARLVDIPHEARRATAWTLLHRRVERAGKELRHARCNHQTRAAVRLLLGAMEAGHVAAAEGEGVLRGIWSQTDPHDVPARELETYIALVTRLQAAGPPPSGRGPVPSSPPPVVVTLVDDDGLSTGWQPLLRAIFGNHAVEPLGDDASDALKPDVVLLDLFHQGRPTGLERLTDLKRRRLFLPVVVLSDSDNHAAVEAVIALGASALFVKELQDLSNRASLDYYARFLEIIDDVTQPIGERRSLGETWERYRRLEQPLYDVDRMEGLTTPRPGLAFDAITRCLRKAFYFAEMSLRGADEVRDLRGSLLLSGGLSPRNVFAREGLVWAEAALDRLLQHAWNVLGYRARVNWHVRLHTLIDDGHCTSPDVHDVLDRVKPAVHLDGTQSTDDVLWVIDLLLSLCERHPGFLKGNRPHPKDPDITSDAADLRAWQQTLSLDVPLPRRDLDETPHDARRLLACAATALFNVTGEPDVETLAAMLPARDTIRRAYYVDDEIEHWGPVYQLIIEKLGYVGQVHLAAAVPTARELEKADFVLLDLFWRDGGADGGLRRLTEIIEKCPLLPVVVITRSHEARHVARAWRRGALAYVLRPRLSESAPDAGPFFARLRDVIRTVNPFRAKSSVREIWKPLRNLGSRAITCPAIDGDALHPARQVIEHALHASLHHASLHLSRLEAWKMRHLLFPGQNMPSSLAAAIYWYCGGLVEACAALMQGVPGARPRDRAQTAKRLEDLMADGHLGGGTLWRTADKAWTYRNEVVRQGVEASNPRGEYDFLLKMVKWTAQFYDLLEQLPPSDDPTPTVEVDVSPAVGLDQQVEDLLKTISWD